MDIIGKETLEKILQDYTGTLLFVSHDRYFVKQVASSVLVFESGNVSLYPYGYEYYLEKSEKPEQKSYEVKEKRERKPIQLPLRKRRNGKRKLKSLRKALPNVMKNCITSGRVIFR